jgi:hypothetical protein
MHRIPRWLPIVCLAHFGCGPSTTDGATTPTGGTPGGATAGTNATGGVPGSSGGSSVTAGTGGTGTIGGASATSGAAGTGGGATAGTGGAAGGSGGDPNAGDTPPLHPLTITAAKERHDHNVDGRPFSMDNRAPKMMGKLIIDLGVDSGGIYNFGLNRGFHVYGGQIFHCDLTYDNREHNGDCRLETVDGVDHDPTVDISYEQSLSGRLAAGLAQLQNEFPEEDWGYFLDAAGKVRWSDVGITGYSHGAQTAARVGKAMRVYRAVSRSGPRDNECGRNDQMPPYDVNCDISHISAWLDEPSQTPMDRFFAFVGLNDGQRGDDQFSMERMGFIGEPVDINTVPYPYDGSHRFLASGEGHSGFDDEKYWPALGIAWGVPQENMTYAAGL